MPDALPFEGCDSETVFDQVTKGVPSAEVRTLWTRMLQEIRRNRPAAAVSYLGSEFGRTRADLLRELDRLGSEE
jgi:hypothetical protein